ncbi:hypothetical protein CHS0354_008260 [Potamilus streckersoni]|uniref:Homeobox domain-containing protein n=1 Tax=Potamilus streckersoni TaxID=2493646 RepID=A0AAE0T6F2_9BIVA|nr:hypothetical protein CHS0354_008260 [Potamilus streckersoni]
MEEFEARYFGDYTRDTKKKRKRKRTFITPEEIEKLESLFLEDAKPHRDKKIDLAKQLGKTENFVNIWFQNRRAKERRKSLQEERDSGNKNDSEGFCTNTKMEILDSKSSLDRESSKLNSTREKGRNLDRQRVESRVGDNQYGSPSDKLMESIFTSKGVSWKPIFQRMTAMAAYVESVPLNRTHPCFSSSLLDADKGIKLSDGRLYYSTDYGYDVNELDLR